MQFYYVWKKVCTDEYRRLRFRREQKQTGQSRIETELDDKSLLDIKLIGVRFFGSS